MSTRVTLPQRQRQFGDNNLYNIENMPSHHNHLPPIGSQTVGGGGIHSGTGGGVKVQQLFEDHKHDHHEKKRENIQNGGTENSPSHLPAVRPTSSTGSLGSKQGSAKSR